jgi:hypothetical protein
MDKSLCAICLVALILKLLDSQIWFSMSVIPCKKSWWSMIIHIFITETPSRGCLWFYEIIWLGLKHGLFSRPLAVQRLRNISALSAAFALML